MTKVTWLVIAVIFGTLFVAWMIFTTLLILGWSPYDPLKWLALLIIPYALLVRALFSGIGRVLPLRIALAVTVALMLLASDAWIRAWAIEFVARAK